MLCKSELAVRLEWRQSKKCYHLSCIQLINYYPNLNWKQPSQPVNNKQKGHGNLGREIQYIKVLAICGIQKRIEPSGFIRHSLPHIYARGCFHCSNRWSPNQIKVTLPVTSWYQLYRLRIIIWFKYNLGGWSVIIKQLLI